MRGEEGIDFQWIVRNHRLCFELGKVKVHCDADTTLGDPYVNPTPKMWEYEERPKITGFRSDE